MTLKALKLWLHNEKRQGRCVRSGKTMLTMLASIGFIMKEPVHQTLVIMTSQEFDELAYVHFLANIRWMFRIRHQSIVCGIVHV
uniref:Uncharacterized protein n=1 Tax=Romanomermis culicivorax TaxID=13658 RepID=A0A915JMV1_ROMCU